ncbi:Nuclear pore complex protein Nup88 [Portunus trituberculatus]|uniref:Nuclear pore complex protein Nup88 n=1 Tax=Portunus trituberculatus TaxID=210409 RepID=A0A5B7HAH1_PORTR|nr:Nuclear pore complex protein Nup88 [Portunus trituberculatus]
MLAYQNGQLISNNYSCLQIHTENFENHIRSTLQRTTSQPLLASGTTGRVTPSEYIHLLNRVMVTLRTNYMQPQKVARMDMEKRSDILGEQKQRLKSDLEDLQARKKALTEKAHELAEKYEDASEKNEVHRPLTADDKHSGTQSH